MDTGQIVCRTMAEHHPIRNVVVGVGVVAVVGARHQHVHRRRFHGTVNTASFSTFEVQLLLLSSTESTAYSERFRTADGSWASTLRARQYSSQSELYDFYVLEVLERNCHRVCPSRIKSNTRMA